MHSEAEVSNSEMKSTQMRIQIDSWRSARCFHELVGVVLGYALFLCFHSSPTLRTSKQAQLSKQAPYEPPTYNPVKFIYLDLDLDSRERGRANTHPPTHMYTVTSLIRESGEKTKVIQHHVYANARVLLKNVPKTEGTEVFEYTASLLHR